MYKVKIYSLPDLRHLGTIRVKNPSAENIAKRMGGTVSDCQGIYPTLDFKDGHRIMYRVMEPNQDKGQEAATNDLHS